MLSCRPCPRNANSCTPLPPSLSEITWHRVCERSGRKSGSCSIFLLPPAQGHHSRCSRRKRSRKIAVRSRDAPRRPTRRCDCVLSYSGSRATRQGATEVISFDFLEEETRNGRLRRRRSPHQVIPSASIEVVEINLLRHQICGDRITRHFYHPSELGRSQVATARVARQQP